MEGEIQYGKLLKKHNIDAVRGELTARSIQYQSNTNWTEMIKLLKQHEKQSNSNAHERYFTPVTPYEIFRWNEDHF